MTGVSSLFSIDQRVEWGANSLKIMDCILKWLGGKKHAQKWINANVIQTSLTFSMGVSAVCTWQNRVNGEGSLSIFDVKHVLDPVGGGALTGFLPAEQREGLHVAGRSLHIPARIVHSCRTSGKQQGKRQDWVGRLKASRQGTYTSNNTFKWFPRLLSGIYVQWREKTRVRVKCKYGCTFYSVFLAMRCPQHKAADWLFISRSRLGLGVYGHVLWPEPLTIGEGQANVVGDRDHVGAVEARAVEEVTLSGTARELTEEVHQILEACWTPEEHTQNTLIQVPDAHDLCWRSHQLLLHQGTVGYNRRSMPCSWGFNRKVRYGLIHNTSH